MELTDVMTSALTKALSKANPNVVLTAAMLSTKYGPMVEATVIAEILGVKPETIKQQISRETFQVPVSRIGSKWYATCYDIAEYLDRNKKVFNA